MVNLFLVCLNPVFSAMIFVPIFDCRLAELKVSANILRNLILVTLSLAKENVNDKQGILLHLKGA